MNMKSNLKKLTLASAILLGYAGMATAHDVFNQPIGATVGATDYFQVTCSNNGAGNAGRLEVSVRNTTDPVGANGVYSPLVTVAGGNGVYNVIVDKTTAAARQYDIQYHCMTLTTGGVHTGTAISQQQNQ
jgi:hypothetical protein